LIGRRRRRPAAWIALAVAALALLACDRPDRSSAVAPGAPEAIGDQECAVCGMIVREQPAPRGQVVHRDGTRLFFCSVSDLLAYLEVPSPHGRAVDVFVERSLPGEDPRVGSVEPHPWMRAQDAFYAVGGEGPRRMGEPVVVTATREEAERVARTVGARALDFEALDAWWKARERAHPDAGASSR